MPWDISDAADARPLGLYLAGLTLDDGLGHRETIAADDPRLDGIGLHEAEGSGDTARRWTAARATLPASLWAGCEGDFFLRLDLAAPPLPHWLVPRKAGAGYLGLVPDV